MSVDKVAHLLHIGGAAVAGVGAESLVSSINPTQVVSVVQIVAQVVIAVVTAFAALRKAVQKPVIAAPAGQDAASA